ncbi:MAG: hypothetical protein PW788_05640 [Micavibrio sp.]|nr:hypothetical protein [Micavibrio sp.]
MTAKFAITAAVALSSLLLAAQPAKAEMKYFQDPAYQRINKDDPNPMEDLLDLADQGDTRAQYILGDLYGKGKGGLGKNTVKSRYWFETSARGGYSMAFIRLAAIAKRNHDYVSAYQWYTLDINSSHGDERKWSMSARDQLVQDTKMDKKTIKLATQASDDWVTKAKKLLKDQLAREKAARDYAEAHPKPDLEYLTTADATEAAAQSGGVKVNHPAGAKDAAPQKQQSQQQQPSNQQETHYND